MAEFMGDMRRTHYCGTLRASDIGTEAVVCGFVQRIRDIGNLVFIDLRDRSGLVQIAISEKNHSEEMLKKAASVRAEFVMMIKGQVMMRESVNPEMPTGDIEIIPSELKILSKSEVPPFEVADEEKAKEELRLKYRYLDLRRAPMQQNIITRHKIVKAARDYYDETGFIEVETPILIKSTPEGARDYLVPSRVHPGEFYALPQSPQLYKQLLMLSGFDRYMQIARCFRDEDLRADRQPEFTQIDLEMSFADVDDVIEVNEGFVKYVFKKVLDMDVQLPLRRMTYLDAMEKYGVDKPDTRFGLEIVNLSDIVADCGFGVFTGAISGGGSVRAINVKGGAKPLTRKEIDKLTEYAKTYRAKGLAFSRYTDDGISSSFEKFLTEEEKTAIHAATGFEPGDALLVVADKDEVVFDSLGNLRNEIAKKLGLIKPDTFDMLWIVDFPQFEYSEEDGRYYAKHHPFTSPKDDCMDLLGVDNSKVYAKAYDLIINGCEVGGGSVRISNPELQARMFQSLGFTDEEANAQFGYLLEAFKYGTPPHAGMAYGLDRLVMLMLQKDSIRDVIAFPKVQNARELMIQSPSEVDEKQLDELSISIKK